MDLLLGQFIVGMDEGAGTKSLLEHKRPLYLTLVTPQYHYFHHTHTHKQPPFPPRSFLATTRLPTGPRLGLVCNPAARHDFAL